MKVCFFSNWIPGNPYLSKLSEHLERLDVTVKHVDSMHLLHDKFDVIHLQSMNAYIFLRLILFKLMRMKVVWTVHEADRHDSWYLTIDRWLAKIAAKLVHAMIAHCEESKREAVRLFGVLPEKIFVIPHPNYVDSYENKVNQIEARKKLGISENATVFLFLGWVRKYKGIPHLINSFKRLNENETVLVIAGKAWNQRTRDELIREVSGDMRIKMALNSIPNDQIQVYLNAADACVYPYKKITMGGGIMLAMSFGRACIAPKMGCVPFYLNSSGSFCYDPDDKEGLYNALSSAIRAGKKTLADMGNYNKERCKTWTWEQMAQQTKRIYES